MNKAINNKLYIYSIGLLCALTYLLNFCMTIYQCTLVFTIIALTVNSAILFCGKSKSLKGLAFAIMISFTLTWKLPYYIDGKIMNGLIFASLSSVMISMYWSASAFQKLRSKFGFIISNTISLVVASIIDGIIMGLYFVFNNNFSYLRILDILNKELSYKMIYALLISAIMFIVLNTFKNNKNIGRNLKINNYL